MCVWVNASDLRKPVLQIQLAFKALRLLALLSRREDRDDEHVLDMFKFSLQKACSRQANKSLAALGELFPSDAPPAHTHTHTHTHTQSHIHTSADLALLLTLTSSIACVIRRNYKHTMQQ